MILTVTMNPSVDMSYPLTHLEINAVNRPKVVRKTAGGKGLNVARVAHLMRHDVLTTGILGGNLGRLIEEKLDKDGIMHSFTHIEQESRNSIAILHDNGKQTELLEGGPTLNTNDITTFLNHFDELLLKTNLVTISGSLPGGMSPNFYATMIAHAKYKGVKVLLDSSGESLEYALKSATKPFLVKPNENELATLLHEKVDKRDLNQLHRQLTSPIFSEIEWVIVSLGSEGAFIKHNNFFYKASIPKIVAINPVGSGDSTIAGLAIAISQQSDDRTTIKTAMTTGILNTMENETGFVNPENFDEYFNKIKVTRH